MTWPLRQTVGKQKTNEYVSVDDFHRVFTEGRNDLYLLSFHLTRDHEKAEQCFVSGRKDCREATRVFRDWARSWAKRAIIQNAIDALKPRPSTTGSSSFTVPICLAEFPSDGDRHFDLGAVLALEDFERFVFVMAVVERYSEHECALLLGCTRRQIEQARIRAVAQLTDSRGSVFPAEIRFEEVQEVHR
jgi:hypothetical protein